MTPALITAYASQLRGLLASWEAGKITPSDYLTQSTKLLDLTDSAIAKMQSANAEPDLFGGEP